jgi:lipopolysaccharide transport system ATP-binding protein
MGQLLKLPSEWLPQPRLHHAVDGINLTIRRGERLGIVGRNGAGKTTLLKLIIGAVSPSSGDVEVNGSVQSLLQTGLGFSQEQTGWDNILSALTLAGMPAAEALATQQEVAEFAELGSHLHQPFRTYSAGMAARLQFATATALRPDILVIDEVLGAGDTYFMLKCMKRMEDLAFGGCTLLLVTHATQQLLHFCDRAVWIEGGKLVMDSSALDVTSAYDVFVQRLNTNAPLPLLGTEGSSLVKGGGLQAGSFSEPLECGADVYRWPSSDPLKVVDVRLCSQPSNTASVHYGDRLEVAFDLLCSRQRHYSCRYLLTFWTRRGERVARFENDLDNFTIESNARRRVVCWIPSLSLRPDEYLITLSIYDFLDRGKGVAEGGTRVDFVVRAAVLTVSGDQPYPCLVQQRMCVSAYDSSGAAELPQ